MPANKTGKTSSFFIQQELVITALFPAPITDFPTPFISYSKKSDAFYVCNSKNYGYVSFAELEAVRSYYQKNLKKDIKKKDYSYPAFPFL